MKKEEGRIVFRILLPNILNLYQVDFAIHSILYLIPLYPLALLHSQRLTTLYDIQTYNPNLLSHHKSYSIVMAEKGVSWRLKQHPRFEILCHNVFHLSLDCTLSPIVILFVFVRHDPWDIACQQIRQSATFLKVWNRRSQE